MTDKHDSWPPDDLSDFDDEGKPLPEKFEGLFEACRFPGMTDEEYEVIVREGERKYAAREAQRRIKNLPIHEIVQLARVGDSAAQSLALRHASRLIYTGRPLPPPLKSYISASLLRRADGLTWTKAFAPDKEGRKQRKALLKAGADTILVAIVDEARAEGLSTKADDGGPGPAFDEAAEFFHISTTQVRKRYYEHLKLTNGARMTVAEIIAFLGVGLPNSEKNGETG